MSAKGISVYAGGGVYEYPEAAHRDARGRRAECKERGHDWIRHDAGAPVADFHLCRRCGRWER